ncbi:MAG: hypothetical protein VKI63_01480 [Cyanobium sp.]|nr:hypothetical protein [Cyanobium sp.]
MASSKSSKKSSPGDWALQAMKQVVQLKGGAVARAPRLPEGMSLQSGKGMVAQGTIQVSGSTPRGGSTNHTLTYYGPAKDESKNDKNKSKSNSSSNSKNKGGGSFAAPITPAAAAAPAGPEPPNMFAWQPRNQGNAQSLYRQAVIARERATSAQDRIVSPAGSGQEAIYGTQPKYAGYTYDPDRNPAGTFNGATAAAIDYGRQSQVQSAAWADYFGKDAKAASAEMSGVTNTALDRMQGEPADAPSYNDIRKMYKDFAKDIGKV